jgi:hypothetical protein
LILKSLDVTLLSISYPRDCSLPISCRGRKKRTSLINRLHAWREIDLACSAVPDWSGRIGTSVLVQILRRLVVELVLLPRPVVVLGSSFSGPARVVVEGAEGGGNLQGGGHRDGRVGCSPRPWRRRRRQTLTHLGRAL